jgi:quinoprotein relay system zinc metallohydrolase 2
MAESSTLRRTCAPGVATLFAWALSALAAAAPPAATTADALPVSELAPGVFVHFGALEDWLPDNGGDVANLGFVVGTRCVAVIDSGGTPQLGQRLRAAVRQRTALPICFVINTHAHPDHVLGNAAMVAPATQFVASKRFNAALSARGPYYLNALQRDFGIAAGAEAIVYAARQVDTTAELDLGERTLTLTAWPTAHTDNDLSVYDGRTRTLFLSDLLFVRHIPVIDGKLRGWLATMKTLAGLDVALAIPGHGPASTDWPAALSAQQDYLQTVLRETRAAIKSGITLAQAVERVGNEAAAAWLLAERFHRRNVTAAYAELEWEE